MDYNDSRILKWCGKVDRYSTIPLPNTSSGNASVPVINKTADTNNGRYGEF